MIDRLVLTKLQIFAFAEEQRHSSYLVTLGSLTHVASDLLWSLVHLHHAREGVASVPSRQALASAAAVARR